MATTSIRWVCVQDIVVGVGGMPMAAGAVMSYGYPGDEAKGEQVWLADIEGDLDLPVLSAGRKPRSDIFRLRFRFLITGKRSIELTMSRLTEVVSAFEDYLADHSHLADDLVEVQSAKITTSTQAAVTLIEGHVGIGEVVVAVHSRLA